MTEQRFDLMSLMSVTVPPGEKGSAKVQRFEITEDDVLRARISSFGSGRGSTEPGEYTKLLINGNLWMSDTHDERRDHLPALRQAAYYGPTDGNAVSVLITGLGLGMVINAMLQLPRVGLVDVVESNQDVIDLVGPHYQEMADKNGVRLNIHHGDAVDRKGIFGSGDRHWDVVWHDIWLDITADNYEDMKSLRRRYGRYSRWQDCWCSGEVKRAYDQDKRDQERYSAFAAAWSGRR